MSLRGRRSLMEDVESERGTTASKEDTTWDNESPNIFLCNGKKQKTNSSILPPPPPNLSYLLCFSPFFLSSSFYGPRPSPDSSLLCTTWPGEFVASLSPPSTWPTLSRQKLDRFHAATATANRCGSHMPRRAHLLARGRESQIRSHPIRPSNGIL